MLSETFDPAEDVAVTLRSLMARARHRKPTDDIEPPLLASDFGEELQNVARPREPSYAQEKADPHAHYGAVEQAARAILYDLVVGSPPLSTKNSADRPAGLRQDNWSCIHPSLESAGYCIPSCRRRYGESAPHRAVCDRPNLLVRVLRTWSPFLADRGAVG